MNETWNCNCCRMQFDNAMNSAVDGSTLGAAADISVADPASAIEPSAGAQSRLMRVLIATDAWHPQVNGVVRTLTSLAKAAAKLGVTVEFLSPEGFTTVPVPTYPGLRLALPGRREIARRIERFDPDAIHVATEGPIGYQVRAYCLKHGHAFTTSYTTRFPEYIAARFPIPGIVELRGAAPLPCRRRRHDDLDAVADEGAGRARLHQSRHVDARRRHRSVQPGARHRSRLSAADLRQRRTGGDREEPRSLPVARPARHQGGDRPRPAGGRAAPALPGCQIPRACWRTATWRPMSRPPTCSPSRA